MTIAAKNPESMAPKTESQSQAQVVWKQFKRNPLARAGMFILFILYAIALFAGFLAPYGLSEYSTTDRISWAPPTTIHWKDDQGNLTSPYVYKVKRAINLVTLRDDFSEDKSVKCPIQFFSSRPEAKYNFLGFVPSDFKLFTVSNDCKIFLWGSDNLGRDQYSRVIYGSQISLTIGIFATILSVTLGLLFGGLAGYFGNWIDSVIMRLVEVLGAIPDLFLLITLRALFPINIDPILVFFIIIIILSFVGWGGLARVVRGQLLAARELEYVQAANALGASSGRVIMKHLLPNTATFVIISISLSIPGFILAESGLSFIGIGVVEPYASWGSLLALAQDGGFESISNRTWVLIPGVFIFLAVLGWQFVGDGLRDAFDPRRRR